jgi:hypothetical protein
MASVQMNENGFDIFWNTLINEGFFAYHYTASQTTVVRCPYKLHKNETQPKVSISIGAKKHVFILRLHEFEF